MSRKGKLFKLSNLSAIWRGLPGSGKSMAESPEQIIVRRWLQGKD